MYKDFWNLRELPFESSPNPRFIYLSKQHDEALARMRYVVEQNKGAGELVGIFGCGKTILVNTLMEKLESDIYKISYITNPRLNDVDILRMIIHHLCSEEKIPINKADLLIKLEEVMINNAQDGKKNLIIIDEAHAIEEKNIFEELRLLMNFQYNNTFLSNLLLIGQPPLNKKIEDIKQFTQRIYMRFSLKELHRDEVFEYIAHRLEVAGGSVDIFTPDAVDLIQRHSGGLPRRINHICDMCLFTGFLKKTNMITTDVVKEACDSLAGEA
ncbi:ExeA family protein [Elusimicrobiota bacterium]